MIVYYHPTAVNPPAHLIGARDLCARSAVRGGCFFGIGPQYLCGFDDLRDGVDVGGGWKACIVGEFDPFIICREMVSQPVVGVADVQGRTWMAPIIINGDRSRAFPVRYGRDWLPLLTPEQIKLEQFAGEALSLLPRIIDGPCEERDGLMPTACAYAAAALVYSNHITSEVLAALGLLDTSLVAGALTVLCSYAPRGQDA